MPGSRRTSSSLRRAAPQQIETGDGHDPEETAEGLDAADIWTPVAPTPALGRKRKVAVLIAAAMLEITVTGDKQGDEHSLLC